MAMATDREIATRINVKLNLQVVVLGISDDMDDYESVADFDKAQVEAVGAVCEWLDEQNLQELVEFEEPEPWDTERTHTIDLTQPEPAPATFGADLDDLTA